MKPSYSFSEMITFINNAETTADVQLIFDVYNTERCLYSAFHAILIDYAIEIIYGLMAANESMKQKSP